MSVSIFIPLSVIGAILTFGGDGIKVDKGLIDGLRPGDTGTIFYTITVGSKKRRIDVAQSRVVEAADFDSILSLVQPAAVRPGYLVEFDVSEERVSVTFLLERARARAEEEKFDEALRYLKKLQERVPNDRFLEEQILEIEKQKQQRQWQKQELERLDYYRTAAENLFSRGDLDAARTYIDKVLRVAPDDSIARKLLNDFNARKLRANMVLIPGGVYEIGVDMKEAKFYNQHPRFRVNLTSFWIDRSLVTNSAFRKFKADFSFPETAQEGAVTGISYDEAESYCRWLGKRLPTEFEWEAAVQKSAESARNVLEWTSSWYQPYPGNVIYEEAYGEKSRVIRGSDDFRKRSFMAPEKKEVDVGFRCACDEPPKNAQ